MDGPTDRDITAKLWGRSQVSEWAVGSMVQHVRTDGFTPSAVTFDMAPRGA